MICRAPETSKVRNKMVYASSKDRFKRELEGIQVELQATDASEMSLDIVKARAAWSHPTHALFTIPTLSCFIELGSCFLVSHHTFVRYFLTLL